MHFYSFSIHLLTVQMQICKFSDIEYFLRKIVHFFLLAIQQKYNLKQQINLEVSCRFHTHKDLKRPLCKKVKKK